MENVPWLFNQTWLRSPQHLYPSRSFFTYFFTRIDSRPTVCYFKGRSRCLVSKFLDCLGNGAAHWQEPNISCECRRDNNTPKGLTLPTITFSLRYSVFIIETREMLLVSSFIKLTNIFLPPFSDLVQQFRKSYSQPKGVVTMFKKLHAIWDYRDSRDFVVIFIYINTNAF